VIVAYTVLFPSGLGFPSMSSRSLRQPPYWPASTGWLIVSIIFANKLWILDATSMSLYWVARLPIERPKRAPSWLERREGKGQISHAPSGIDSVCQTASVKEETTIELAIENLLAREVVTPTARSRKNVMPPEAPVLGASSGRRAFYSPAAPIGRLRRWKIALSLAVVGALAAPFAFRTYKAHPTVWVPLTAKDKEERANYLDTDDCESFEDHFFDQRYERSDCDMLKREGLSTLNFKIRLGEELATGERDTFHTDLPKYWMVNVGTAAATAVSLFGLAYLIPMLIRGVAFLARGIAFLARRYWRWLNA
jgi:hypothetical protein